ncbi:MAG: hypothetical protein ACRYHA_10315 [Janthinobacterium lividum]
MVHISGEDPIRSLSWGAVFAGVFVTVPTYLVLSLLGAALGAAVFDPLHSVNPFSGMGTGTAIWFAFSTLVAIAFGGFVAGRTAPGYAGLHGLLSWSVATLMGITLLFSLASTLVGASASIIGKGVSVAGQGIAAVAPAAASALQASAKQAGINPQPDQLKDALEKLMQQSGKPELAPRHVEAVAHNALTDAKAGANQSAVQPQAAGENADDWLARVKSAAQPMLNAADREALVNIIAQRTGRSHADAEKIADNYAATYAEARGKAGQAMQSVENTARQSADTAASVVSKGSWIALVVLLIGALVSFFSGLLGRDTNGRIAGTGIL